MYFVFTFIQNRMFEHEHGSRGHPRVCTHARTDKDRKPRQNTDWAPT